MCRLVLMNKNGEREIEKKYGLINYFDYLEQSYGGHGNGISLLRNGKVILLQKGVNLTVRDISRIIKKINYDWCIFHTRYASVGAKTDKNCHPFMIGTEVMAMNGTESSEKLLIKSRDITDTEAILCVKEKFNLEIPALKNLSGIYVGFSKGNPYVVANNTRNIKLMFNKDNNSIVFASEFPDKLKNNIYAAKGTFIWNNGSINMDNFREYVKEKTVIFEPEFNNMNFSQTTFDEIDNINEKFTDDIYFNEYIKDELEEYKKQVIEEYEQEEKLRTLAKERMWKDAA